MKLPKYGLLATLFFIAATLSSQPLKIGKTRLNLTDPSRGNRTIKLEVYYPADTTGKNVPFSSSVAEPLPFICFGHGFIMPGKAYGNFWSALVPEGYIFVILKKERGLSPSHVDMGLDLAYVANNFPELKKNSSSIFYNRIDDNACLMGHSMGGGAAFLAATSTVSVKAVCTLAAYDTEPSALEAAAQISVPALVFAGSNDCVCPPEIHQIPMYDALKSKNKTFISITGGSHCQMALKNKLCNFGERTCFPGPEISREEQHRIIRQFMVPWLNFNLKNNSEAEKFFYRLLGSEKAVTFKKTEISEKK